MRLSVALIVVAAASLLLAMAGVGAGASASAPPPAEHHVRQLSAADFARLYSAPATGVLAGEDAETPLAPWAVHFSLPWERLNASSAFAVVAAKHFTSPSSKQPLVRFAELVLDTPEALAVADMFALKMPAIHIVHGQQTRFDKLLDMAGLPFADVPADTVKALHGAPAAAVAEADVVRFVARAVPRVVFGTQDHTEMPSVIKVTQMSEVVSFMAQAAQTSATVIVMQPFARAGAKKQAAAQIKFGREWIQLAATATGAQFVGRDSGMVFIVDGTVVEGTPAAIAEFGVSKQTLEGTCAGGSADAASSSSSPSTGACFDLVTVAADGAVKSSVASRDIFSIHASVRSLVEASGTGKWAAYYARIVAKQSAARGRFARVYEPMEIADSANSLSKPAAPEAASGEDAPPPPPPVPTDTARQLHSTVQFNSELRRNKGGLFVIALLRRGDRSFERHLRAVNELAAALYRNRMSPGRGEARMEVYWVDTDQNPGAAEGFAAVQVPCMFVVHHLTEDNTAVAQYRGEFSADKLRELERFVRETCFDNKVLGPFRADRVVFERKGNTAPAASDAMLLNSFHVPFRNLVKTLPAAAQVPLDAHLFVAGEAKALEQALGGAGAGANKAGGKSAAAGGEDGKPAVRPEVEARRSKAEAAKQRAEAEKK